MSRFGNSSLAPVIHGLAIYDGASEELIDFIEIKHFNLAQFKKHFDVFERTDPHMHHRYSVGPDDAAFVNQAINRELQFDFKANAYFIEAVRRDCE